MNGFITQDEIMELDDDQDTHICLKCQTTIIGLDNYVAHKKRGCLIDKTTRDEHRPEEATRETSTTTSTTHYQHVVILPAGSAPASNETRSSLEHLDEDDEDDEEADEEDEEGEVKPDDFFLSLELQSNSKTMDRKSSPKKDSDGIKKGIIIIIIIIIFEALQDAEVECVFHFRKCLIKVLSW